MYYYNLLYQYKSGVSYFKQASIKILNQFQIITILFSQVYFLMEISIRRKLQSSPKKYRLSRLTEKIDLNNQSSSQKKFYNSALLSSFDTDFAPNSDSIQSSFINETVRAKASVLLSLPATPRLSGIKSDKNNSKENKIKMSLMFSPKKKVTVNVTTESFKRRQEFSKNKYTNFDQFTTSRNSMGRSKKFRIKQNTSVLGKYRLAEDQNIDEEQEKRKRKAYFSLSQYFLLVFSKMLSKAGKQNIYTFIEQLAIRYQKYPETIHQDVIDMRKISDKLALALGPKQNYIQLKPFEALQVDGEIARLMFHLTHDITARKYKNFNMIKIYKEIEYCARKLQFHKLTLKICFELGQLYKQQYDEMNSHAYFVKAFKLAIFLRDKFYEQKIIDYFGMTSYYSNKSGEASYFHHNTTNLDEIQRQLMREKYSNLDELQKISREREGNILVSEKLEKAQLKNFFQKKKQSFNFNSTENCADYEMRNRRNFKQKISQYIQCPVMRANTLIARNYMNKINKIGRIERYKEWQASNIKARFHGGEYSENCCQVLLSHRSLNRKNPEFENKTMEKERKILLQLINYYTNQSVSPFC